MAARTSNSSALHVARKPSLDLTSRKHPHEITSKPFAQPASLFTTLSNDILLVVLKQLDPPSAVCWALSNRQLYQFVSSFCKRNISDICPRTEFKLRRPPVLLQKYPASQADNSLHQKISNVCSAIQQQPAASHRRFRLNKQYTALMLRLHQSTFMKSRMANCLQAGHIHLEDSTKAKKCLICREMILTTGILMINRAQRGAGWTQEAVDDYTARMRKRFPYKQKKRRNKKRLWRSS